MNREGQIQELPVDILVGLAELTNAGKKEGAVKAALAGACKN